MLERREKYIIQAETETEEKFRAEVQKVMIKDPLSATKPIKYKAGNYVLIPSVLISGMSVDNPVFITAEVIKGQAGIYLVKFKNDKNVYIPLICEERLMKVIN